MTNGDAFRFNGKCPCGAKFSTFATFCYERCQGPAQVVFVSQGVDLRGPGSVQFFLGDNGAAYAYDPGRYGLSILYTCRCGSARLARPVIGRYVADKACDGRCMAATGHSCECQCGGKNHGAANA